MPPLKPYTQITDDIYQVRIPLPFALNIVNCYLLRAAAGWTVVDTGLNTEPARQTWRLVFDVLKMQPGDIQQIILTHTHPDHLGMAGWLQEHAREQGTVAPVYMSLKEQEQAELIGGKAAQRVEPFILFLRRCGMPEDMVRTVAEGVFSTGELTLPVPEVIETLYPDQPVQIGQRTFSSIHAPGHSDGQLIFYDAQDQLMLSGDQVLMKITPNIGLWDETEPDPLGRYLKSLGELKQLPVRLALPGHKTLIEDWQGRLSELELHHAERIELTYRSCVNPTTAYEASQQIFTIGRFSPHEWRFAMVEALAHLEYLVDAGRLQRDAGPPWRYWQVTH